MRIKTTVKNELGVFKRQNGAIELFIDTPVDFLGTSLNAQQARELATELNRLADEMEEKFYIKVINSSSGYLNLSDDGTISLNDCEEIGTLKTQFTQAEIDANPDLKKFDSNDFKVRVEEEK